MTDLALALVPMNVGEVVLGKLERNGEQDVKRIEDFLVQRLWEVGLSCILWA